MTTSDLVVEKRAQKLARAAYKACPVCLTEKPVALNGEVHCRACAWSVTDAECGTDIDALLDLALTLDWTPVLGPAPGMERRSGWTAAKARTA